jgi:hypothetical protein
MVFHMNRQGCNIGAISKHPHVAGIGPFARRGSLGGRRGVLTRSRNWPAVHATSCGQQAIEAWHGTCNGSRVMRCAFLLLPVALVGCQTLDAELAPPELDVAAFRCEVEPVLMARCATYACHGAGSRPFRVFAINRLRLNPQRAESGYVLNAPMTAEEHDANLDMALGFAQPGDFTRSQLLLKPLDVDAGGLFHRGGMIYGRVDVFSDVDDVGYESIEAWLAGGTRQSDCEPNEEVGL